MTASRWRTWCHTTKSITKLTGRCACLFVRVVTQVGSRQSRCACLFVRVVPQVGSRQSRCAFGRTKEQRGVCRGFVSWHSHCPGIGEQSQVLEGTDVLEWMNPASLDCSPVCHRQHLHAHIRKHRCFAKACSLLSFGRAHKLCLFTFKGSSKPQSSQVTERVIA
jgi:hypothetical protein